MEDDSGSINSPYAPHREQIIAAVGGAIYTGETTNLHLLIVYIASGVTPRQGEVDELVTIDVVESVNRCDDLYDRRRCVWGRGQMVKATPKGSSGRKSRQY